MQVLFSSENGSIEFHEFRDLVCGGRKDTDEDIRKAFRVSSSKQLSLKMLIVDIIMDLSCYR